MLTIPGFWLSPTYDCNNRCRWCYAGQKLASRYSAPLEKLQNFVRLLHSKGARNCILVGGEPTSYPQIFGLVRFITQLGMEVRIMSNGRALADINFVLELKKAGLNYCAVSIEGTETVHDFVTRIKGSFWQSMQGLENLQTVGIRCNSITTVSSFNLSIIDELVAMLYAANVPVATFNMCSAQPSGFDAQDSSGQINLAEYARIVERVAAIYDFVRFYALVPLCYFNQTKLPGLIESGKLRVACSLYGNSVAVDPYGNLNPCTHMPDLSYGNLDNPEALDIFLQKRTKESQFLKTHAPSCACVDCRLWTTCLGGCNLIWFNRQAAEHIPGLSQSDKPRKEAACEHPA